MGQFTSLPTPDIMGGNGTMGMNITSSPQVIAPAYPNLQIPATIFIATIFLFSCIFGLLINHHYESKASLQRAQFQAMVEAQSLISPELGARLEIEGLANAGLENAMLQGVEERAEAGVMRNGGRNSYGYGTISRTPSLGSPGSSRSSPGSGSSRTPSTPSPSSESSSPTSSLPIPSPRKIREPPAHNSLVGRALSFGGRGLTRGDCEDDEGMKVENWSDGGVGIRREGGSWMDGCERDLEEGWGEDFRRVGSL